MMSFFRLNTLLLVLVTTWTSAQQTAVYSNENQDFNNDLTKLKELWQKKNNFKQLKFFLIK